ncbi:hypothetical protein GCM10022630_31150 [Thermobifida alba]
MAFQDRAEGRGRWSLSVGKGFEKHKATTADTRRPPMKSPLERDDGTEQKPRFPQGTLLSEPASVTPRRSVEAIVRSPAVLVASEQRTVTLCGDRDVGNNGAGSCAEPSSLRSER